MEFPTIFVIKFLLGMSYGCVCFQTYHIALFANNFPNICSQIFAPITQKLRQIDISMLFSLHDQKYRDVHDCDCFWRIYYADGKTAFVCKRGSGWKTLHSWPKMVFGEKEVCSSRKNTHIINPPTTNKPPLDRRALIRGIARPAVLRREKGGHWWHGTLWAGLPKM